MGFAIGWNLIPHAACLLFLPVRPFQQEFPGIERMAF